MLRLVVLFCVILCCVIFHCLLLFVDMRVWVVLCVCFDLGWCVVLCSVLLRLCVGACVRV